MPVTTSRGRCSSMYSTSVRATRSSPSIATALASNPTSGEPNSRTPQAGLGRLMSAGLGRRMTRPRMHETRNRRGEAEAQTFVRASIQARGRSRRRDSGSHERSFLPSGRSHDETCPAADPRRGSSSGDRRAVEVAGVRTGDEIRGFAVRSRRRHRTRPRARGLDEVRDFRGGSRLAADRSSSAFVVRDAVGEHS